MATQQFDVTIVGGGMNGATLALALGHSGLRVALVEALALETPDRPSYDDRAIALAQGTVRILDRLGIWQHLRAEAEPIRRIHISDRGHFGVTRLDSAEEGVAALGQVALARDIGAALNQGLQAAGDLQLFCPAQLLRFEQTDQWVHLQLDADGLERSIDSRLLVAADGAESPVRKALGIGVRQWQYGHHAVVTNVTPDRPHQGVAYERFTDTGPLAMLPMPGNRCGVVWTTDDAGVEGLLALDDAAFLQALQERFGYRLGRLLHPGKRTAYALSMMQVRRHFQQRVVLIGNAAHRVHPIAGQGFNLGIRDVDVLAELLNRAAAQSADPGDERWLRCYASRRDADQRGVTLFTDVLARLFSNPLQPLPLLRNLGLLGIDLLPPAKHAIARRAMGLHGHSARGCQ
jgi:2-octaprenyl-6-methoxyphenol hydroxylase